jgi:hypothetical protein
MECEWKSTNHVIEFLTASGIEPRHLDLRLLSPMQSPTSYTASSAGLQICDWAVNELQR